jgi:hypothetical protein
MIGGLMSELVPRKEMVKQALKGVGGAGGGILLLFLSGLPALAGWIIGAILVVLGLGTSSSKSDRISGLVITAAGVLTILAQLPIIGGLGRFLMGIGGLALIGGGLYSLFQFFKNLKARG